MTDLNPPPSAAGRHLSLPEAIEVAGRHQAAGRLPEAEAVLREILKVAPKNALALHLMGIIAFQSGQRDTAIRLVTDAIGLRSETGLFHTNLCEILRLDGQLELAIEHGERGAALDPDSATAHSNVGVACYDNEDYAAAERHQRKALALNPALAQALNNIGSILRQQDDADGAITWYRKALDAEPNHLEALNNLGAMLNEVERPEEARAALFRAVQLKPDYAEAHRNIGTMFVQEENFERAEVAFREALKHRPDFVEALIGLATVQRENQALDEAERTLEEALRLEPDRATTLTQIGMLCGDMGFPERALEFYDRGAAAAPDSDGSFIAKGHLQIEMGDMKGAAETLAQALAVKPESIGARLALVQLKKVTPDDDLLTSFESELDDLAPEAVTRRLPVHFALGKCYDDIGDSERAMQHYLEGCRLKRTRLAYRPEENERHVERLIGLFDKAFIDRLQDTGDDSQLPVFVLGMPRSGTTLTEQIIASHSQTHGAGELPDLLRLANVSPLTGATVGYPDSIVNLSARELASMGARYVAGLRERNATAARITDKMPANFFCVGLIHLMLPRARIIHVRRNPVDTCLSGLTKLFRHGQGQSYDLHDQGRFYVSYARLMDHWRKVLPPGAMFEIQYEDLVAETETKARAMIDYCGLEWEDGCLEFHKTERSIRTASVTQVRQPIYKTSVARWKRYESSLGPLLEALGDLVER